MINFLLKIRAFNFRYIISNKGLFFFFLTYDNIVLNIDSTFFVENYISIKQFRRIICNL